MAVKSSMVTIIIPVYNVEKYLDRSVRSAVNQTYSNLEIILVDDGSTDQSGAMCDRWKEKDDRITVIHKKNGGLSSARNAALDICQGDYVFFLDSDDYLDEFAIEILMCDAEMVWADMVEASFCHVYGNKKFIRYFKENEVRVMTTIEAIRYDLGARGTVSACAKLYRRAIFATYRFQEGKLNEDHYSIVDILSMAGRIAIEPQPLYYYVHRRNSITTGEFSPKSFDDLEAAYKNRNIIQERFPQALDVAEFRIDFSTMKLIDKIMLSENWKGNEYLGKLVDHVRRNRSRIMKSQYIVRNRKIAAILLLMNRTLYQRIVKERARRCWSG